MLSAPPSYDEIVEQMPAAVAACVPPGATVAVVSRGDDGLLRLPGLEAWHFPRTPDGAYAGHHPGSSAEALEHLEEVRHAGAGYIAFPRTSFWWLDHYGAFASHLERTAELIRRDELLILFRLPASESPTRRRLAAKRRGTGFPARAAPVAVVITSHNKGAVLDEALTCLSAQTLKPHAIVVVDDASTDDPEAIAAAHGVGFSRVEYRSPARARNHGAYMTAADYLCFFDADDLLDDDFLEAHLAVLEARPTAGFAFGRIREFGERQRLWPKQVWDHDLLRRWNYVPAASVVRTSAFRQVGGYPDLDGAEDWGLWLRLSAAGWRGESCDTTWRWRRTADSRNARRTWGAPPPFADEAPLECMSVAVLTVLTGETARLGEWAQTLRSISWDRATVHVWLLDISADDAFSAALRAESSGLEGFAGVHVVRLPQAGHVTANERRAAAYQWAARHVDSDLVAFLGEGVRPSAGGAFLGQLIRRLDWTAAGVSAVGLGAGEELKCALIRREALRDTRFEGGDEIGGPEAAFAQQLAARGSRILAVSDLSADSIEVAPASVPGPGHSGWDSVEGTCTICGSAGTFRQEGRSIRETYRCPTCQASLRYRHQACVLLSLYARSGSRTLEELVRERDFRSLAVYEPGLIGPFRRYFATLPDYTTSYFWPDVPRGALREGVRCEDLQALTFPDDQFDLVITSDIFEHVRRPYEAFAEIDRVLRPGGRHVFTIPMRWPLPDRSVTRVDTASEQDVHTLPPVRHGSPTDPEGSLVYTDFGTDLVDRLDEMGVRVQIVPGLQSNVTLVAGRERLEATA